MSRPASISSVLSALLLGLAAQQARAYGLAETQAPADAPVCPPASPSEHRFTAGESLLFKLDVFGADVGTFELWLEPAPVAARARATLLARARARTSAFVAANTGRYQASASALIGRGLAPVSYSEEVQDGTTRFTQEARFPAKDGVLPLRASRNGEAESLSLPATASARDLISAFLLLRGAPLIEGTPLCFEFLAARRMWKMAGVVGPRETIDSPLGRRETVRLDLTSTRLDAPGVTRVAKFWVTDDARRLPIAAIAEVRGKVIRAQLQPPPQRER